MLERRFTFPVLFLILVLALVSGCRPGVDFTSTQPAAVPPGESVPATPNAAGAPDAINTPAEESQAGADPMANCPREEPGKRLYASEINGFCFLYPEGFTIQPDELRPDEVVKLVGPREEAGPKQMEVATVTLWVASNGRADVPDSAAYAQKWRAMYIAPGDPAEIGQSTAQIGGHPAVVLDGLPGMILQRAGFVVANGFKYSMTISPQPGFVSELDEPVRQAWDMMAASMYFFPPLIPRETALVSHVCPQAGPGTKLLVQEAEGYCFLYPEDFYLNRDFNARVEGGPNLGNWEGFENVHVSLTVGGYPMLASDKAQTPRDHAARISDVDPNSVQDRTIGGAQAVVFKVDPQVGPWASRQAYILTESGRVYTIVNDPWEPERWPESSAPFEAVWETVTGSLTFFTPWK